MPSLGRRSAPAVEAGRVESAPVQIRPAEPDDVELLHSLIVELATYEKAPEQVRGTPELLRRSLFEQKLAEALLVAVGDEPVGYAFFFTTFSTWECRPGIWLEDVFIRPQHRRGGIGRAVLAHIARIAVERGCARLDWCALDWNEPALNFYDKLGARRLAGFRQLLDSALDANLTQVSVRQNEDMRTISAWVAILAVPTMVAGIYGMNFDHMPELRWELGYPAVLVFIAIACSALYWRFKRIGWL